MAAVGVRHKAFRSLASQQKPGGRYTCLRLAGDYRPLPADREDAVPPGLANVEGCPRLNDVREGRSPLRPVFFRTARTRSLPWDLVGGAQSSVPDVPADGGDAVPPGLSELARAPGHRVWLQVPQRPPVSAFPCGPRGRGPFHGTLGEGHSPLCLMFLRTAGMPSLPACRSSQGHPAIGCGCRSRTGPRGLPFLADREDAVPPMGPCGRGTVLCARHSYGRRGRGPFRPFGAREGSCRLVPGAVQLGWGCDAGSGRC